MRVAFAGTPEFAATILRGILDSEHEVGLVISQPDARRGRGRKTSKPPVANLAATEGIKLLQPERIGDAAEEISTHDILVVAAYGQILHPDTLYATPHGAFNVHASLLPKYRGAAPIERAIMAGETETGISIMKMDEGLDTGPIALQKTTPINPETTGDDLYTSLAHLGSEAIVEVLTLLERNDLILQKQDNSLATYAPKITSNECIIQWKRDGREIHDLIRALSPHIGARTFHPDFDGPVRILRSRVVDDGDSPGPGVIWAEGGRILVGCDRGVIEVLELQVPGGRPLSSGDFLRGHRLRGSFAT